MRTFSLLSKRVDDSGFSKMSFIQTKVIWINNEITGGESIPWVIEKVMLDWMLLSVVWIMYKSLRKFLLMACIYFPFHNHLSLCYSRTIYVRLSSISLIIKSTRTYIYFSVNIIFHRKKCCLSIWGYFLVKKMRNFSK